MSVGLEQNKCDCTRTGFYGENCSTPKFLARMKLLLKPTASTVYSVLTHFTGFWNIVSNISFLRNSVMRYGLPARSHLIDSPPTYKVHTTPTKTEKPSPTSPATSEPLFLYVADDCPTPMVCKGERASWFMMDEDLCSPEDWATE